MTKANDDVRKMYEEERMKMLSTQALDLSRLAEKDWHGILLSKCVVAK